MTSDAFAKSISLPDPFAKWFAMRGWSPHPHQLALLKNIQEQKNTLLIAPTGAGKTLAGFLPSLVDLSTHKDRKKSKSIHTLYISPLKALAVDIERNLEFPIRDNALDISVETRTGDTPTTKRARQVQRPPDILLTTPEQVSLLLAHREAANFFSDLKIIIIDELHAIAPTKRGELLSLALARLRLHAPNLATIGLSATVRNKDELSSYLVAQDKENKLAEMIEVEECTKPQIEILKSNTKLPLAGHTALSSMIEIYEAIVAHHMCLVFVNTRMQAEFVFQALWKLNEKALPIALHHGSLDKGQRRKVEAAMAEGKLRAIVCTATLDLGIDWGDVDLVINIGAPKGSSRLMQRIGRSNHRFDQPSEALLVPANRFESLECQAALGAIDDKEQDTASLRTESLDVLAQHILGMACAGGFIADDLYREITSAYPYHNLARVTFDNVLDFVATGGYALRAYDNFARLKCGHDMMWRISHAQAALRYRMNVGTIIESTMVTVRFGQRSQTGQIRSSGRKLGQIEDYFAENLTPGDTFLFGGEVVKFEAFSANDVIVSRAAQKTIPKIPVYSGGRFPLSTYLAKRVREIIAKPQSWAELPLEVSEWLTWQKNKSIIPKQDQFLVECFPEKGKHYLVLYPFEGRLAHQTLGVLLTKRLERLSLKPLGFVCNDYGLAIWAVDDIGAAIEKQPLLLSELLAEDMLGDDLEAWLEESSIMRRAFRNCAIISGLIEKQLPGERRKTRSLTISSDLIYDVLRRYQPDHILLKAARADAAYEMLDLSRLNKTLKRLSGHIIFKKLEKLSPLSIAMILEIGRETVYGDGVEALLAEAEAEYLAEALS